MLVVDDEPATSTLVARLLRAEGPVLLSARDGKSALRLLASERPDLAIVELKLPDVDGLEILRRAKALDPEMPVVILTAHANVATAVAAMRADAFEYLAKPCDSDVLLRVLRRALGGRRRKVQPTPPGAETAVSRDLSELMGSSPAIRRIIDDVNRVAKSDFSVVILGETGSGKEVIAQGIRRASLRAGGPFVPVDCGAIPEALFEAELFGHEKGAFTGAAGRKLGRFEQANGGTLLLDEITNMSLLAQAKVLRALQERSICRVGGTEPIKLDVRVLAAGNQDLETAVAAGRFRSDLFYRLNEFVLRIPPLRERPEDILHLAGRFLALTNQELRKQVQGFSADAERALLAHPWPGNVRQLRSTVRRAVLLADRVVTEAHLDLPGHAAAVLASTLSAGASAAAAQPGLSLKQIAAQCLTAVERDVLEQTLQRAGGNKARAARLLQIDYKTIQSKVKRYGITT